MAGHIDMMIDPPVIILPQLPGGSVKAYAVLAKSRLVRHRMSQRQTRSVCPVFTSRIGSGFGYPEARQRTLLASSMTLQCVAWPTQRCVRNLPNSAIRSLHVNSKTPEALGALQKAEIDKWLPIIKSAHTKGD